MKWFKFYGQDYLSDPKILALSACERSCFITLLCYGSVNEKGEIKFLSEEQLMAQSGISPTRDEWDATVGVLSKLEELQIIKIDNGVITLLNWLKRQENNLSGYERIKKYREKKQNDNANDNTNDNAMITLDKNRIDKNIYIANALNRNSLIEKLSLPKPIRSNITKWQDEAVSAVKYFLDGDEKQSSIFKCFKEHNDLAKYSFSDCKELSKNSSLYFFKIYNELLKKRK